MKPGAPVGDQWEYSGEITNTTWTRISPAASADYYYVCTYYEVINSDATVGTDVFVYEDANGDVTDATLRNTIYAAALGGGSVKVLESGLFSSHTANMALYVVCETTSSETKVNAKGYRTKLKPVIP